MILKGRREKRNCERSAYLVVGQCVDLRHVDGVGSELSPLNGSLSSLGGGLRSVLATG